MKIRRNKQLLNKNFNSICDWVDYIVKDIESYDELTDTEKSLISEDVFNQIIQK